MVEQLILGSVLISITVAIHGAVMGWLLWHFRDESKERLSLWRAYVVLAQVAVWCVLAHLVEIALWSVVYLEWNIMPDFETALYFSAVTYATIGYGDVVPPANWRVIASMEGLIGILMCAWSGGFIYAIVARLYREVTAREQA
jgi:hypothetical protein